MRELRFLFWFVVVVFYATLGWVPGLLITLVLVVVQIVRMVRLRRALRPTLLCPRNHTVPVYGLYRCSSCGAVTESWAWRCPHCRFESGYVSCPTCGLSVANPLLRGA